MKKSLIWMGLFLVILIISACAGNAASTATTSENAISQNSADIAVIPVIADIVDIKDIRGRDWVLAEIKSSSGTVRIDRTRPGAAEVYTLRFEEERIIGVAAPNRYFGPYASGENNTLSMGMVASTLMAPLFENEDLKEYEYFGYLNRVNRWNLLNGNLELYTISENGIQVILVYR